jgi:tellurite resistance protein
MTHSATTVALAPAAHEPAEPLNAEPGMHALSRFGVPLHGQAGLRG